MANNQSTFTEELGYLIDEFDELQDLRYSDLQYLDEYRELKMRKNDGEAINQNRLDELELIFKNKIVTSARWNKFQEALVNMQTFIKTEVEGYVLDKQTEMNTYVDTKKTELDAEIDKFEYKGVYDPTIQYYERNIIDYNDGSGVQAYLCIQDSLGNEPINTTFFKKLTIKGARGERGEAAVGLKFKGEWDSGTTYSKDDGVQYGGILFASLIDGNIDSQPDLAQDTPYWAKALDVTVTVKKMIGTRNIATQTSNVNFMTGEITSFNPSVDSLEVYQNSVRLTKGVDYTINPNNQSIDKVTDIWDASSEQPIFFEFIVTKNILNNLVFSDGSAIEDGTIAKSKLTTDVQSTLNQVETNQDNISTNAQNISTNQDNISTNAQNISTNQDKISILNEGLDTHKAENVTAHNVSRGISNFVGNNQEVTIPHGLGVKPTSAYAFPTVNPNGYLGEVWIKMDETNLYIGNSGSFTGEMSWVAIG